MLWEDVGVESGQASSHHQYLARAIFISDHRPHHRQRAFITVANRTLTYINLQVGDTPVTQADFRGNQ